MFQAREAFDLLANSDKLDGLLDAAQKHAQVTRPSAGAGSLEAFDELDATAKAAQAVAADASQSLREAVQEHKMSSMEKADIVEHMIRTASALVA